MFHEPRYHLVSHKLRYLLVVTYLPTWDIKGHSYFWQSKCNWVLKGIRNWVTSYFRVLLKTTPLSKNICILDKSVSWSSICTFTQCTDIQDLLQKRCCSVWLLFPRKITHRVGRRKTVLSPEECECVYRQTFKAMTAT